METLQAQLSELEAKKAALYEEPSIDSEAIARLNEQIKAVSDQLAAAEKEQQVQAQVEEKVAAAQAQVSALFESITFGDQTVALTDLVKNEGARQIITVAIKKYVTDLTGQVESENIRLRAQKLELEDRLEKKNAEYDTLVDNVNEMRKQHAVETSNLRLELEDMTARRDAAGAEIAELKSENEQLKGWNDDLQKQIALGVKGAIQVVDVSGEELIKSYKEQLQKEEEAKPAIYDVTPLDNRKSDFQAKYAETDEVFQDKYLYLKGKYRVVTAEEAAEIAGRFRAEREAAAAAEASEQDPTDQANPVPDLPLAEGITPPPVPPFQGEETTTDGLDGDSAVPTSDETGVTRAEFEALKLEVQTLKAKVEVAA